MPRLIGCTELGRHGVYDVCLKFGDTSTLFRSPKSPLHVVYSFFFFSFVNICDVLGEELCLGFPALSCVVWRSQP